MFGIFKNLFKKSEPAEAPAPSAKPATLPPAPAKPAASAKPASVTAPAKPAPAPTPAPSTPAPRPPVRPADASEALTVSLAGIAAKLPESLKAKVANLQGTVAIAKKVVNQQLPSGAVKITFGELRAIAPPGAVLAADELDQTQIELPLSEIIQQLGPTGFTRRTDQRVITIPDEVVGLFGAKGAPVPAPKTTVIGVAPVEKPVGPAPTAAPPPPPPPAPKPAPAPVPAAPEPAPVKVSPELLKQMGAAAGAAPEAPAGMVAIPVAQVSQAWPESVKAEVAQLGLANGHLLVPTEELAKGLKVGKVVFTWQQVLAWTNPALASKHGMAPVELALKVVAPLYLAKNKPAAPRKTIRISDNIPDMFTGKQGAPAAAPKPAPPAAPAPAAPPPPAPAPPAAAAPTPAAPVTGPTEAVQRACRLAGVAGAVVASEDGLSVAAQLPASLKAENVAAFVPQIYYRMAQYTRDLGAGQVERLSFTCGGATWQISKGRALFLAVVSKPGANVPADEVDALATQLTK